MQRDVEYTPSEEELEKRLKPYCNAPEVKVVLEGQVNPAEYKLLQVRLKPYCNVRLKPYCKTETLL